MTVLAQESERLIYQENGTRFINLETGTLMRDFTKLVFYNGNPVIPYNIGAYNTLGADVPYIRLSQKIGNTYYMITQGNNSGFTWTNFALYTSTDLITWTPYAGNPILTNTPGAWDHTYIQHPSIINIGGTWYMYYTGVSSGADYRIGLATSSDFIHWTKYAGNPIYDRPANTPTVIQIGSTYFMYYWNCDDPYENVAEYATSPDGITWTYQGVVLARNPGDWDEDYYNIGFDTWVIKNRAGFYEMVYSVNVDGYVTPLQKIGYATSPDGITWTKFQGPILEPSGIAGSWDESYVGDPVLLEVPGYLYLYYTGVNAGGMAQGGLSWLVWPQ